MYRPPQKTVNASHQALFLDLLIESEQIGLYDVLDHFEKQLILRALECNQGNKTATAAMLKISRRALYNKLSKHHIL
jgi:DNA-binding NtrC family response regulator